MKHINGIIGVFALSIVLALSSCSGSKDSGGGGGGGSGSGSQIASIPQLDVSNGYLPTGMRATPSGVALSVESISAGQLIFTVSTAGVVTTAVSLTSGILTDFVLDGKTIYYLAYISPNDALYSVPLGGGTATQVLVAPGSEIFHGLTSDADNIYIITVDSVASAPSSYGILKVAKSTQTSTSIYTAAAGQSIDNLYVDGTTLYWSETAIQTDQGAVTVRSASLGGGAALTAADLGTLPAPAGAAQLVATSGVAVVANVTASGTLGDGGITIGTGDYAFTPGGNGQPKLVSSVGSVPIAVSPGILYYNDTPGLSKATVDANGIASPTTIAAQIFPAQMAADSNGALYYIIIGKTGVFKL
jgi:hypothetical protein